MLFRNILLSAIVIGALTGTLYGLFQHAQISPIIYAAEQYELSEALAAESHHHGSMLHSHAEGSASHSHESVAQAAALTHVHEGVSHSHSQGNLPHMHHAHGESAASAQQGHDHHHGDAWAPADGLERISFTILADIAVATAFALLMVSFMALHNAKSNKPKVNAYRGVFWGLGALASFFLAPTLFGLHPEVPGTLAGQLDDRQAWWTICAGATLLGLAALYYLPARYKVAGVVLALLPHVVGTPLTDGLNFANTDPAAVAALTELTHDFVIMSMLGAVLFCLSLGGMSGYMVKRYINVGA